MRGLWVGFEHRLDRLLHAAVVHLDALSRQLAHRDPVGALEVPLGLARRVAKQAVVLVESGEDGARDPLREVGALLVNA